jgi:hypothetical protein
MIIIDTFERGCTPRHRPTVSIGIGTSSSQSPRHVARMPLTVAIRRRPATTALGQ